MTRRLRMGLYDQDAPGVLITELSTDSGRTFTETFNEPGSGSLTVGADDPQAVDLDCRNIVRCMVDGVARFAWVIESRRRASIPRGGEPSSKLLTVSGRGVLALMETAVVEPERGTDRLSPPTRLFNFASTDYSEVGLPWVASSQIKLQGNFAAAPLLTDQWDGLTPLPQDWPDPTAYWIWGRGQSTSSPPQPIGYCYFRRDFNISTQGEHAIFITADDGFELYLDGALVAEETRAFMFAETKRVNVLLDVGQHWIAIVGRNIQRDSVSTNVAGVLYSILTLGPGGELDESSTIVINSSSATNVLAYPAVAPTMTPGEIMRILLDEAQQRGGLESVTLDFDDDVDSNGSTWDTPIDLEVRVGTSYLGVLQMLAEVAVDIRMTALLELQMFNKGTLGSDLTGIVQLEEGVHLSELEHSGECARMNAALFKRHTGTFGGAADAASIADNGRLEAYLELGTAPSDDQATRTLVALFDEHSVENITVQFQPEERGTGGTFVSSERPYVGWQVGDLIIVPGIDDMPADTRVQSITVSDDPSGGPDPIFRAEGTQHEEVGS